MHGGELVEQLGIDDLQAGLEQLGTNQQRQYATQHQHGETEQQIQSTNVFVVGREHPTTPARGRVVVVIIMGMIVMV